MFWIELPWNRINGRLVRAVPLKKNMDKGDRIRIMGGRYRSEMSKYRGRWSENLKFSKGRGWSFAKVKFL